ncbi:hypothetical protein H8K35_06940 [Undibacterium sp. LX40W]|uniref:Uncharacterized protein n=1 Tax=Undibacterium nitidum TaxID=2762298 RepID=A0A923HL98_9BURK|nr:MULTISPECIES: hypothetical protein [Undibacterium]MBC3879876.1 hypothetical protein [Undibacterium nitidum]MBC3891388.1 hypothetical protein [Undibacterium sp. LX40W]
MTRSYRIFSGLMLSAFFAFTRATRTGDLPNHRFIYAAGKVVCADVANIGEINFEWTELNPHP